MPYEDDLDPIDPHQALIDAVRRNPALVTPTQGERKKPTRREQAWDMMQRANDLAARPVQPYQGGGGDLAAGMALSAMGGRALAPMGGQILKQTLAARAPLDPVKLREMEVQNLMRSGALAESMAQHEESAADRAATLAERSRAAIEAAADRRSRDAQVAADRSEARALRLTLGGAVAGRAGEAADARREQGVWRTEDTLRDDFNQVTKPTRDVLDMARGIGAFPTNGALSPVQQQSLVVLLNKFQDPGSVVRESEFDRVIAAQGLLQKWGNVPQRIATGQPLPPALVKDIQNVIGLYTQAAENTMRQHGADYARIVGSRGGDPSRVVPDPRWRGGGQADVIPEGAVRARGAPAPKRRKDDEAPDEPPPGAVRARTR